MPMDFYIWVGHAGLPTVSSSPEGLLYGLLTILREINGGVEMKLLVHVDKLSTCFYLELEESLWNIV